MRSIATLEKNYPFSNIVSLDDFELYKLQTFLHDLFFLFIYFASQLIKRIIFTILRYLRYLKIVNIIVLGLRVGIRFLFLYV